MSEHVEILCVHGCQATCECKGCNIVVLEQMLARALQRVTSLGQPTCDAVFDGELQRWYSNYLETLPADEREENEAMDKLFGHK